LVALDAASKPEEAQQGSGARGVHADRRYFFVMAAKEVVPPN
jgi:hypothetical protein